MSWQYAGQEEFARVIRADSIDVIGAGRVAAFLVSSVHYEVHLVDYEERWLCPYIGMVKYHFTSLGVYSELWTLVDYRIQ